MDIEFKSLIGCNKTTQCALCFVFFLLLLCPSIQIGSESSATVNLKPFAFLPPSCHSVRWAWPAPPSAGGGGGVGARTEQFAQQPVAGFVWSVVPLWNNVTKFLSSLRPHNRTWPPVGSAGSRRVARPGPVLLLIPQTLSCSPNRRLSAAPGFQRQRSSMCLPNS